MHVDADTLVYTAASGNFINSWKFMNDTLKVCQQATQNAKPSYNANDLGLYDQASVSFASGSSGIKYLTFPDLSLTNATVFVVASQDPIDNARRYFLTGAVSNVAQGGLWFGGTLAAVTGFGWESMPPAPIKTRQSNVEPIGWQVFAFRTDKLFLNGIETGYTVSQTASPCLFNTLGGMNTTALSFNNHFKGRIAELIVYDGLLNVSDIAQKSDSLIAAYLPPVDLGPDMTGFCGTSAFLQPQGGRYYNSYLWSTGATTREITVTQDGTYWIQCSSFGKITTDSIVVSGLRDQPVLNIDSNLVVCKNRDTLAFFVTNPVLGEVYQWNTGETADTVYVTDADSVYLSLYSPSTGCHYYTDTVTLASKTKADFDNTAVCPRMDALFQNLSTDLAGDTLSSYYWNFGDPSTLADTSADTNGVWNYAQSGTYSVYLKITASDGCADSIAKNVTVKPTASANFTWQGICYATPTQFFDASVPENGTQVTGYQWTFGPGITSTFVNPAVTFDTANVYPVTLVAYTASGCMDTVVLQVPVNKGAEAAFAVPDSLCAGQPVSVTDQSQGVNDNLTQWVWRFGNNAPVNGQTPQFAFQGTGSRIIRLTVTTAAGCADSVQKTVYVRPSPTAAFAFTANGGTPPFTPSVTNQSTGAVAYAWNYGNGFTDNGSTPVLPVFADTGTYTLYLAVTNAEGCTDTVSHEFVVFTGDRTLQLMAADCKTENGFVTYTARVLNKGALEVNRITFGGNLDYNSVLREKWQGTLQSGQVMEYVFNSSAKYFTPADFCCVRIENFNDTLTVQPPDDEICLPLTDNAWFSTAYPTPTEGIITVDHTLPFADKLSATLCSVEGKILRRLFTDKSMPAGFGSTVTDITDLRSGLYVIRFTYRDKNYSVKVLKK